MNINSDQLEKLLKFTNFSEYLCKLPYYPNNINFIEATEEEKTQYYNIGKKMTDQTYNPDPIFSEQNFYKFLNMMIDRYININSYVEANLNSDVILISNHLLTLLKISHLLLFIDDRYIFNLLILLINFCNSYEFNGSYSNLALDVKKTYLKSECLRIKQLIGLISFEKIY